ncbi:MAG: hypothetical protein QOD09_2921 [Bradyrhizobium sp.]|jgi:hypothetical protein|nr:hypothetical protein [Bradyrhizobium sp.]
MKQLVSRTLQQHFPWALQALRSARKIPTFRYRYQRRPYCLAAKGGYTTGESGNDHEANEFTGAQLIVEAKHAQSSRMPDWMTRSFVEEVVEFTP